MAVGTVFLTIFRLFQFVSYLFTAFAFVKHTVLPAMRLSAEVAKTTFSSRHPAVHWPGRTSENKYQSRLVTPVDGVGPFAPRYRVGQMV